MYDTLTGTLALLLALPCHRRPPPKPARADPPNKTAPAATPSLPPYVAVEAANHTSPCGGSPSSDSGQSGDALDHLRRLAWRALQRLQVGDQILDLSHVQFKLGHLSVRRPDTF